MRAHRPPRPRRRPTIKKTLRRKGAIIVFAAILMVVMMGMIAFSVDVGYMMMMRGELQRSVDSAALAGASGLIDGEDIARAQAIEYLVRNPIGGYNYVEEDDVETRVIEFLAQRNDDLAVELGHWNSVTRELEVSSHLPSTIGVSMTYPNNALFFGRFVGKDEFNISAESVAMYQPRDIMLVLDLSASMNDDSEFKSIGNLGREHVEGNLREIYEDLGEPIHGSVLEFPPKYLEVEGIPPSRPSEPQLRVQYRYDSVKVWSTKDLSNIVMQFSDGTTQKIEDLTAPIGEFSGTGYNAGKPIYRVWVKCGQNHSGDGSGFGEGFDFSPSVVNDLILTNFDLKNRPYPYPNSGSWTQWIEYCKSKYGQNASAGYRWQFGYMNLMNFWLENKPRHSQTPDLWKVRAQPVTAVKDAVDVFLEYIQEVDTNDRVGVAVYNAYDGEGVCETELTDDFQLIEDIVRERQAGHYHNYTNIGAGMHTAREELDQHGRLGAFKMIVLITDGNANWVNGGYNTQGARQYVLDEAQLAADRRYPIVTISLGAGADTWLMQQVAEITESTHFIVPGGQSVEEYSEDLKQVFHDIAGQRPLQLVK
jgi:hypothetical protein